MKSSFFKFSIRDITEIAIMCALAIVFDRLVKIPVGQTGGSINFSTVPLFLIAYRHGWFKGLVGAGLVYGVTTCLLDAYGFQYFFFDYFVAFGSIAIGGLFGALIFKTYNKKSALLKVISIALVILTVVIFFVVRTLSASMDSMIFYHYTFMESVIYNVSYIGPSAAIVAVILAVLLPVFSMINELYPSVYLKDVIEEVNEENENNDEQK